MTRVLIALDETDEALHAGRVARELFGADAEYIAVNVAAAPLTWGRAELAWGGVYPWYGTFSPADLVTADDLEQGRADAEAVATRAAALADLPREARTVGEVGDPVDAILDAAEEHRADVIVVGPHERGWWSRLVDGSVSKSLLRASHRPVLVVRREEQG